MELHAARQLGSQRRRLLGRRGGVHNHMAQRPRDANLVGVAGECIVGLGVGYWCLHVLVGRVGNIAQHRINRLVCQPPQIVDGECVGKLLHGLFARANLGEIQHGNTFCC